ncbi:MAG: TlpA disulfide reductase family protein [Psychroserpens sp.]|uniref:TlpA family protein disulfide reductase n=1 Tax=Psychroserpens sp. TaxID=2020870 RepID=UPI003C75EEDF
MKKIASIIYICFFLASCQTSPDPVRFSEDALQDVLINRDGDSITFKSILEKHKGKTILVDVWASWCRDCIVNLPDLKTLQKEHREVVYLFLSLDKSQNSWQKGIEKHNIIGDHYFMSSGMKGDLGSFLNVDWIPRYMIIDENGLITMFKAAKVNDPKIKAKFE